MDWTNPAAAMDRHGTNVMQLPSIAVLQAGSAIRHVGGELGSRPSGGVNGLEGKYFYSINTNYPLQWIRLTGFDSFYVANNQLMIDDMASSASRINCIDAIIAI